MRFEVLGLRSWHFCNQSAVGFAVTSSAKIAASAPNVSMVRPDWPRWIWGLYFTPWGRATITVLSFRLRSKPDPLSREYVVAAIGGGLSSGYVRWRSLPLRAKRRRLVKHALQRTCWSRQTGAAADTGSTTVSEALTSWSQLPISFHPVSRANAACFRCLYPGYRNLNSFVYSPRYHGIQLQATWSQTWYTCRLLRSSLTIICTDSCASSVYYHYVCT